MKDFLLHTFILLVAVSLTINVSAQSQKVVADKIIAQVGDKIILQSDIVNAIADYKRQGQEAQLPPNPECAFLEGQLVQKVLVLQAERDSLPLKDDELEGLLDNQIRYFINLYGSKEALEEIAGKTIYQLKEDFRQPFKERKLAEDMRNKILQNVKITPTEVKEYYEQIPKDSLPFYESELEMSQLVIMPKPNKDVEDYIAQQLLDMKKQVESGAKKFDALAKLYSQDPGSKDQGGQYSLNKNDRQWDPAFLSAAFRLKEGQISPVVKSKFGLHIIQMVSRAGDDAVIRHILLIPPITDAEINIAKQHLDSIRTQIVENKLSFNAAVNLYSDDENSKYNAGAITAPDGSTYVTIDQLDKDLVLLLKDLQPGNISAPQVYTNERGNKALRIVYLKTRTEPHRENLKDDYNRIAQKALEEKKQKALEKWFQEHIPNFYVQIDKEYISCPNMQIWWKNNSLTQQNL